jgi:hypothetical protein
MRVTKRQLRRIIKEEKAKLKEYGGRPYDPTIPGDFERARDNPTGDAPPGNPGWDDEEGDDDWRWEPEQRQYQEYEKWARDNGHVTPAASSVMATYFVEQELTDDKEQIDTIAAGYRIDPQDVMRDIKRQQAEQSAVMGESRTRITKRQLRRIIREEYHRYILNEVPFHDSNDEDHPGKKQTVVFDQETSYDPGGQTHGEESHALKHFAEFEPGQVQSAVEQALSIAREADDVYIIDKGNNVVQSGDDAKKQMNANSMLNTLDLINDKQKNGESLTAEEEKLAPVLQGITDAYDQLIQTYLGGEDIDGIDDVEEIKALLDSGTIVKFTGVYKGSPATYYLDPSNTGLVAEKDGVISTLFRIDKKGGSLKKVGGYFSRGVELTNPAFGEALGVGAKDDEEAPQQQQKKKKEKTQQKAGTPEEFVKQLKARGLPAQALKGALTGWMKKNAPDRTGDIDQLLSAGHTLHGAVFVERWQRLAGILKG